MLHLADSGRVAPYGVLLGFPMRSKNLFRTVIASLAGVIALATAAQAQDLTPPVVDSSSFANSISEEADYFGISEVRFGAATSNFELYPYLLFVPDFERSFDHGRLDSLQADVIFDSPDLFRWIGSPRPAVGTVVNLLGYESLVHAGLNWHWNLFDTPVYVEAGLGVGLHNGYLDNAPSEGFRELGCRTLIHWQYGVGTEISEDVTLTLQWQHLSNYIFGCYPNEGINNLGLVVGYKF